MNISKERKSKIAIAVFTIIVLLSGWIGRCLDKIMGTTGENSLGMLVWLLLPLISVIIIKKVFKASISTIGLKPKFKDNKISYLISFFFYPVIITLYLVISLGLGSVSLNEITLETIIPLFITLLITQSIKNIFEEFSWRGYLAPELFKLKINKYASHIFVGITWALWHIPYNYIFIDIYRTSISQWFYPIFIIGIIITSFIYGEIRYRVNSVWPAVIMHTLGNALLNTLILSEFLNLDKADSILHSIGQEGLIIIGLTLILGTTILTITNKKQRLGEN